MGCFRKALLLYRLERGPNLMVLAMFVFLTLFILREASASQAVDTASGLDQSFTVGHTQKAFAEDFHMKETYGVPPVEKKSTEAWKMHTAFNTSTLYNSNRLDTLHDPSGDLIYGFSPSITIDRQGNNNLLQFFYDLNYTKYVVNSKLNHLSNDYGFNSRFNKNRWTVAFTNSFKPNTAIATGERTELDSSGRKRAITMSFSSSLNVSYQVSPKTSINYTQGYSLFYLPVAQNSAAVNAFSTHTYTMSPRISYSVTPKTVVFVSYSASDTNFIENGDLSSWAKILSVGANGKLGNKTGISTEIGFTNEKYNDSIRPAIGGLIIKSAVNRRLTEKISGSLSMTKDIRGTFNSLAGQNDKQETLFYGMNLSWIATPRFSVNLEASYGTSSKGGFVTMEDPDNPTLSFTREQKDEIFSWGLAMNWSPRSFMNLTLAYDETDRNSSFKSGESEDQKILGTANFSY